MTQIDGVTLVRVRFRHHSVARRRHVWVNVTANPTAEWVARQLTEAFS